MSNSRANPGILKAITAVGSQSELARLADVSQPCISKWLYKRCPAERVIQLENVSGVSRKVLRPDLYR